ncbi:unnamed protein product [Nippostrongylus brasiliensis]|uniref:Fibronectin type-III domain-containing protein n=1 Tax=Nippostrongylus brasiliensis TaxID=27835 RepID=A0A0N4YPR1_NIPBR|nr:unnamed protein product [Nippostrongylus brasiliensis]
MKSVLILLAASSQLVSPSSLLVDWSSTTIPESIAYVLDYAPAVGNPLAGTSLGSSARRALITDTIPACEYTIYLSAIMPDGKRKHVAKKTMHSSPEAPVLDSIETNNHEAIVSYFPPKESNISFHIEYYPKDEPEYANAIDTKASLVRLRGLYSGTTFLINCANIATRIQPRNHDYLCVIEFRSSAGNRKTRADERSRRQFCSHWFISKARRRLWKHDYHVCVSANYFSPVQVMQF